MCGDMVVGWGLSAFGIFFVGGVVFFLAFLFC